MRSFDDASSSNKRVNASLSMVHPSAARSVSMIDRNKSVFGARELTLSRAQFRDRQAVAFATRTHLRATTHSKLSMWYLLAEEAAAAALLAAVETGAGNIVVPFCMQLATQMHAATPKGSLNGQPVSAFPHALSSVVHQLQED